MTREEAIKDIQENIKPFVGGKSLDMAIEALSQPIVCKDCCIDDDHIYCSPKVAERVVEALHAERPRWIPCSERLPEELSVVNVTYVNHDPEPYYDFVKDIASTETAVYYRGDWYWNWSGCVDVLAEYGRDDVNKVDKAVEVTAWMPLPTPWRGEAE